MPPNNLKTPTIPALVEMRVVSHPVDQEWWQSSNSRSAWRSWERFKPTIRAYRDSINSSSPTHSMTTRPIFAKSLTALPKKSLHLSTNSRWTATPDSPQITLIPLAEEDNLKMSTAVPRPTSFRSSKPTWPSRSWIPPALPTTWCNWATKISTGHRTKCRHSTKRWPSSSRKLALLKPEDSAQWLDNRATVNRTSTPQFQPWTKSCPRNGVIWAITERTRSAASLEDPLKAPPTCPRLSTLIQWLPKTSWILQIINSRARSKEVSPAESNKISSLPLTTQMPASTKT